MPARLNEDGQAKTLMRSPYFETRKLLDGGVEQLNISIGRIHANRGDGVGHTFV